MVEHIVHGSAAEQLIEWNDFYPDTALRLLLTQNQETEDVAETAQRADNQCGDSANPIFPFLIIITR